MSKYKGFFTDWKITEHIASHKERELWIFNGFSCFRDYNDYSDYPFLYYFSTLQRYRIWRELKREIAKRGE